MATATGGRRDLGGFAYQPALDGVRALAVAAVVAFHAGWRGLPAGYLGVSVFFTLSGYLITSLLLLEHERTGRISLGAFYGRRLRRLVPASVVCLAGVVIAGAWGRFDYVADLRREVLAAASQLYNWFALAGEGSYEQRVLNATGRLAPLDHYWSLAIEEQFYAVWPAVIVFVVARAAGRRRVAVIVGLAVAAAVAAPLIAARWGADAAYWATPARLGELLTGAALAAVAGHCRLPAVASSTVAGAATAVGGGALAVIGWAAATWPSGSGPAYTGWLPVFSLATVALIAALQVPSPLRRALSMVPLVALGRISYGVYLFHWPVFALIEGTVGRLAVTLAVAVVSYLVVERPVRAQRWSWPLSAAMAVTATAVVAVLALAAPLTSGGRYWEQAATPATFAPPPATATSSPRPTSTEAATPASDAPSTVPSASARPEARPAVANGPSSRPATTVGPTAATTVAPTTVAPTTVAPATVAPATVAPASETDSTVPVTVAATVPLPERPIRVLITGDSTAQALAVGAAAWAQDRPEFVQVVATVGPGCGMVRIPGTHLSDELRDECAQVIDDELPAVITSGRPDIVVVMVTVEDTDDRVWDPAEGMVTVADERYLPHLIDAYDQQVTRLVAAGATSILWLVPPNQAMGPSEAMSVRVGAVEAMVERYPGVVHAGDLAAWVDEHGSDDWRPDGLHLTPDAAHVVAAGFLEPAIVQIMTSPGS